MFTVFYMAGISAFFTACVAMVYSATRERVRFNRRIAERRVVMQVLGLEVPQSTEEFSRLYRERIEQSDIRIRTQAKEVRVLKGYDAEGNMIAYIFPLVGRGFWDQVKGYMAVKPDLQEIQGLAFYEQSETPGLGAEITEPWFEQQFRDKKIPPDTGSDDRLIGLVRPGREKAAGDVDAVTGATGTSKAVEKIINVTLKSFLRTMRDSGTNPNEE
jgi:Na+-transporting NADH:ubiquinone oxidoreductase subunit C